MRELIRIVLAAATLGFAVIACGSSSDVSPEDAVAIAREAPSGPLDFTTTYAAQLPAPMDVVGGTIEGVQETRDRASFIVSLGLQPPSTLRRSATPRRLTLDAEEGRTLFGRLAVVPTDVLDLVSQTSLRAIGEGTGFGDRPVEELQGSLPPDRMQQPTAGFVTSALASLIGPLNEATSSEVAASVTVTSALLTLRIANEERKVESLTLRVEYTFDADRLAAAAAPYLAADAQRSARGPVRGAANFHVRIKR